MEESMKHFILVHGACHGAWCWYKLKALLMSAGHKVTALDLAASGIDRRQTDEVQSFDEYVQPLMETMASLPVPTQEKVILVSHSFGGCAISLAMERFPEKISVAVFAAAFMPTYASPPVSMMNELFQKYAVEPKLDFQLFFDHGPENPPTKIICGQKYLGQYLYQCCKPEDLSLATMLVRPAALYMEDLSNGAMLSKVNYGSVNRVYIVCKEDQQLNEEFQRSIIENSPPKEVKEIDGAGHMVMLSKPTELFQCLLEIVEKHA